MKLYNLHTEYRENPMGIGVQIPRFSWKLNSKEQDTIQSAYQIIVSEGDTIVWDTGRVENDTSILIPYGGKALLPITKYHIKVRVWDNHGNTDEISGCFETAFFSGEDFQAKMITHDFPEGETACPVFWKRFVSEKKIVRAKIYVTSHGVYELSVNGRKVGTDRMTPGWTSYHHRLQYQIYDASDLFCSRENLIEITVGNGWYKGIMGFALQSNIYGDRTGVFAEIHLYYEDQTKDVIITDENWNVRTGLIRYSEIYMGETIDTDDPEICEGNVIVKEFDKTVLTAQENEPVRITERIPAKEVLFTPKGEQVVDFGQNITGLVEIKVCGQKGQKIVIRHAETLDKNGNFYPDTLRQAKSVDTYICNGKEQVFLPHFTFHGFRYICVEGIKEMQTEMFTACVIHSDIEKTGEFRCSNPNVNQLQSNITWGQRDNFLDIPTDCPQRDERLGWTGDAQIFSWTAAFNRNTALFFSKWMRDLASESSLEKGVPHVVPDIIGQYSSSAWSDAAVIVPWVVYQTYGDKRILQENWKCMHEWVDYITNKCGENGLWQTGFQYGDWLALDKEESSDRTGATDKYLVANAYYIYVTDLVAKTARVLGKYGELAYYEILREKTLESFREEFYTSRGRIVSETQTGCVLSLYFNLAREKDREKILGTLVSNIENHKNHLTTGFVGTPYICHTLSENGRHDMASILFMKEDYPSWLYAVNMGATTIWERWNSVMADGSFDTSGMNSLNHYAYGSIGDWMYRKITGLNQTSPGYKTFEVRPMFVRGLEEAEVQFESVYGKIVSSWSCRGGMIRGKVVVPPNTQAVIFLPEKPEEEAIHTGSGIYEFEYNTETSLTYERFSMDSTFGEILEQPLAVKMFQQVMPDFMDNPMINFAKQMTLSETAAAAPQARSFYETVIKALNEQDRQ